MIQSHAYHHHLKSNPPARAHTHASPPPPHSSQATLMNGLSVEDGRSIEVTQCGWDDIMCAAEPKSSVPIVVHLRKSKLHPKRPTTLRPDFALIRNEVSVPGKDYRNQMFGLMFAGVQSVNSFSSIYSFCEKAVVQAELFNISRRCGMDANGDEIFPGTTSTTRS
mmetsp:Transcript_34058/g.58539  ORF Transcript_34058/g.58539 Transcript_34058/m.58539 type:complete len:165 (-) Transcript_34058:910-1404(-)